MSHTPHVKSWYAASAQPFPQRLSLNGAIEADVVIIGAGYTGLSSGLHLAEAGYNVVLLEAARVGFGASGRNGGQIVNGYSRDIDTILRTYGPEAAKALGDMAFEGGNIIRERVKKYGIQCNQKDGGFFAAFSAKQMHELERHKAVWAEYGKPDLQMISQSDVRSIVATDAYVGGMIDPHGGQIHPLNLAQGEAQAIESLGGRIYEDSPVIKIDRGEAVRVHTAHGSVNAKFAIIAGNAYLGQLVPELAAKSMPCGSQICTTEVLGEERARALIPSGLCVEDCNYKLDYYRITDDFRLLFGGGVTYGGGDPASIEGYLRPHFEQIFPSLKNVKVEFTWGGNFLLTLTRIPQFGRIGNNIYYAQGYSGHGVTTTHLAGKLIAEALKGHAERFDAFAKLPHYYFPGGRLLRVPYTVLGAWYYGLRDKLGI